MKNEDMKHFPCGHLSHQKTLQPQSEYLQNVFKKSGVKSKDVEVGNAH